MKYDNKKIPHNLSPIHIWILTLILTSPVNHSDTWPLFCLFTPSWPHPAPARLPLSPLGLRNAHCPPAQDISQCSQAQMAQRVPERKPKIVLPIYLSAAQIDPFTSSARIYESARNYPQNKSGWTKSRTLSLYIIARVCLYCLSLFCRSCNLKVDHMVCETDVFCWDDVFGATPRGSVFLWTFLFFID